MFSTVSLELMRGGAGENWKDANRDHLMCDGFAARMGVHRRRLSFTLHVSRNLGNQRSPRSGHVLIRDICMRLDTPQMAESAENRRRLYGYVQGSRYLRTEGLLKLWRFMGEPASVRMWATWPGKGI